MKQVSDVEKNMENIDEVNEVDDVNTSEICEVIEKADIEPEKKQMMIAQIKKEVFRGPIPSPRILQQYGDIKPEYADTIVEMAVKEQRHRHEMDNKLVSSEVAINEVKIGTINAAVKMKSRLQMFGFVITVMLLLSGVVLIYMDKNAGSIVPFIFAFGSFCWTMFYGKRDLDRKDDEEKESEE